MDFLHLPGLLGYSLYTYCAAQHKLEQSYWRIPVRSIKLDVYANNETAFLKGHYIVQ